MKKAEPQRKRMRSKGPEPKPDADLDEAATGPPAKIGKRGGKTGGVKKAKGAGRAKKTTEEGGGKKATEEKATVDGGGKKETEEEAKTDKSKWPDFSGPPPYPAKKGLIARWGLVALDKSKRGQTKHKAYSAAYHSALSAGSSKEDAQAAGRAASKALKTA